MVGFSVGFGVVLGIGNFVGFKVFGFPVETIEGFCVGL
jgi:hypothetical protein